MQLKENTKYRLRNGWVVGDLVRANEGYFDLPPSSVHYKQFNIPFPMWEANGRWDAFSGFANDPEFDIVEEI